MPEASKRIRVARCTIEENKVINDVGVSSGKYSNKDILTHQCNDIKEI
jgi:hypothetical protein